MGEWKTLWAIRRERWEREMPPPWAAIRVPSSARASAVSLPEMPTWAGIHLTLTCRSLRACQYLLLTARTRSLLVWALALCSISSVDSLLSDKMVR